MCICTLKGSKERAKVGIIFKVLREMLYHGVLDDVVNAEDIVSAELWLNFNVYDCYVMIAFMVRDLETL